MYFCRAMNLKFLVWWHSNDWSTTYIEMTCVDSEMYRDYTQKLSEPGKC